MVFNRIYSINRPGCLLNFWTLRVGAYSRWALIWGWALIKFSAFSTSVVCLFCNKTINSNNKTRRCNKVRFLWNTLKKTPSSGKSLISTYSILGGWGGAGRLFEFEWEWEGGGEGTYSRWALIRGWALIRINTVCGNQPRSQGSLLPTLRSERARILYTIYRVGAAVVSTITSINWKR